MVINRYSSLTSKLSDKDKKDWQDFLNSSEKLEVKDIDISIDKNIEQITIDLHGYTLDQANKKISKFPFDGLLTASKSILTNLFINSGLFLTYSGTEYFKMLRSVD